MISFLIIFYYVVFAITFIVCLWLLNVRTVLEWLVVFAYSLIWPVTFLAWWGPRIFKSARP